MDFQHRAGGKTGSGGVASASESNRDRRERLRQLALETIDINKDPYFMKNHLGSYECKLCLTLHNNEVRRRMIKRCLNLVQSLGIVFETDKSQAAFVCIYRAATWLTHKERSIRPTCKSTSCLHLKVCCCFFVSLKLVFRSAHGQLLCSDILHC